MNWKKVRHWLSGENLWSPELDEKTGIEAWVIHTLRFSHMTYRHFKRDNLQLHAASLTFNTLLALVPLFTLGFAVVKGLGYGETFLSKLKDTIATLPDQIRDTFQEVLNAVIQTNFAKLGGIGGLVLLILVIQVLGRIETSINQVWGINKQRSFLQKMTSYISVTIIVPLLVMAALALTRLYPVQEQPFVADLIPFVSSFLTLTLLYMLFPNTNVRLGPALASGLITAILFQVWFKFYAIVQPGVTNYNVIYGTLATVPIFLAWLYISWLIVLVGVELSFALQNYSAFKNETQLPEMSFKARVELATMILVECANALEDRETEFQINRYSEQNGVPLRYLFDMARFLEDLGYLAETSDCDGTYLLKRHPDHLDLYSLIDSLYQSGAPLLLQRPSTPGENIKGRLETKLEQTFKGRTLGELMLEKGASETKI